MLSLESCQLTGHGLSIVKAISGHSEQLLERLRSYRADLERRIAFLESGGAEVRLKHEGEWVDASPAVITGLYQQYGDLGALISDVAAGRV